MVHEYAGGQLGRRKAAQDGGVAGFVDLQHPHGGSQTVLQGGKGGRESRLGLGLSIAKLITREMGGELFYRSDDNGNYFRVEFNVIN